MTELEFLTLAKKRYSDLAKLKDSKSFYDHEKEFSKIWQDLGREVLESSISKLPADRRKKKH